MTHRLPPECELIEGVLVSSGRRSLRHEGAVEKVVAALMPLMPSGWGVRTGCQLVAADSQIEPDVLVARETLQEAQSLARIWPSDVGLLVEVAEATLVIDRRSKGRVYARENIPWYWVINLVDRQLEIYSHPSGVVPMPGYAQHHEYRGDDAVSVVIGLDDLGTIRVDDLLP